MIRLALALPTVAKRNPDFQNCAYYVHHAYELVSDIRRPVRFKVRTYASSLWK
jgi:hypothetical protein